MYWELTSEDLKIMGLDMDTAKGMLSAAGIAYSVDEELDLLCFTADDENPLDGTPDVFQSTAPTPDVTMKPSQGHAGG
jgi:hypothetical protein